MVTLPSVMKKVYFIGIKTKMREAFKKRPNVRTNSLTTMYEPKHYYQSIKNTGVADVAFKTK